MTKRSSRRAVLIGLIVVCLIIGYILHSCYGPSNPLKSTDQDLTVVGYVDEFEVLYEELRFAVLTYKQILIDTYGDDIFEDPDLAPKYKEMLKESVYDNITANYAVLALCKEVGIERDDSILLDAVQKKLDERIEELGGKYEYKKFLRENHMTDSFFRFNILVDIMQNELFYVYTDDLEVIAVDDDDIYDAILREFVRTQHIYISKDNSKSYSENKELISEAYDRLNSGEDFMTLAAEYGEDTALTDNGFYIPVGYMGDEYDDAAFNLSVGEYSNIIEDDSGFYIIKRLELNTVYILMNFDALKDRYQSYAFLDIIDSMQKELEFKPSEYFAGLDILEIK